MRLVILAAICGWLSVVAAFAQSSDQKEAVLSARQAVKEVPQNRKLCDKLGFPASLSDNRCFHFYPSETLTWGKRFSEGLAKVTIRGKAGFINEKGKLIISAKYRDAGEFSEGLAPFENAAGKWGYIDKNGRVTITPQFDWAISFAEGLGLVQVGELWGYVEHDGRWKIEPRYNGASSFSEGLASVVWYDKSKATNKNPEGKWHNTFIDNVGNIKLANSFDRISRNFNKGIAFVSRPVECAYGSCSETFAIDRSGERLWTLDSFYVAWLSDDAITVAKGKDTEGHDLYSVLGRDGRQLFENTFSRIGEFSEGVAPARLKWIGKYGFIDKSGRFVINELYDSAHSFSEGLAAVEMGSRFGYVDRMGQIVVSPQFAFADKFNGGFALVAPLGKARDTTGYIDRTGKYIWKPTK